MNDNLLPEIFLIDSKIDELFIADDYFIIYQNSRPFYYKKIEEKTDIEDLKLFVKNHLGIKNIKVTYLKDANWKNKEAKVDYKFINAIKNSHFLYYILYLSVLILIFIYFYVNTEKKHEVNSFDNLQTNIEKVKKDKTFTYISKEFFNIYENTKDNNLIVNSILFENSKFLLILESEKKDGIYKLLANIENSLLEDMQYNKEKKKYEAYVSFKISRN